VIVPLLVVVLGSGGLTTFGAWHGARPGLQQDPHAQATTEKRQKKNKTEKKEKKKAKKAASVTLAPDEINDPDETPDATEPGVGVVWKQHPSIRIGDVFRLDFEAKLQEDLHSSYPGAPGLNCPDHVLPTSCMFQLHRNRIGIKGTIFKKIEYEVERELTEKDLVIAKRGVARSEIRALSGAGI